MSVLLGPALGAPLDVRANRYGEALQGPKSETSSWNFLAAAAALALGIELKSVVGTVSGLAWLVSQAEAWVDEANAREAAKADAGLTGPGSTAPVDWKIPASAAIIAASIWRASRRTTSATPVTWRWV